MATSEPSLGELRRRVLGAADDLLARWTQQAELKDLPAPLVYRRLVVTLMRSLVAELAQARGLSEPGGRLFDPALGTREKLPALVPGDAGDLPVEVVGQLYETLLGFELAADATPRLVPGAGRKRSGSFYTPTTLTQPVVETALAELSVDPSSLRICDPALGAGAFLVQAARALAARGASLRHVVCHCLHGVDQSALAVAVAEASLWLLAADPALTPEQAGRRLRRGNALVGLDPLSHSRLALSPDAPPVRSEPSRDQADALIGAALEPLARPRQPRHLRQARELVVDGTPPASWRKRAQAFGALHWPLEFPEVFANGGFDLVIGNPPWVAYAGRAAKALATELRSYYAAAFQAWRGYPTLHGLFVERSARIAPNGTLALLLPSPIADLDGYRHVRLSATAGHRLREPLLELGQDAFEAVTQPCFVLVADAAPGNAPSERTWVLSERQRAASAAETVSVPDTLERLASAPTLPRELFGEMGFQTASVVSKTLLLRADEPDRAHTYPLLEGRNVSEFRQGPPRLFLNPDGEVLARARCRLRRQEDYQRVKFVVRQTATVPIAALHGGLPFRNSLLAGFHVDELPAELMVGLLNSALYRALHLVARRDARQAAFPQVKIAHLRALPKPPARPELLKRVAELTRRASERARQAGAPGSVRDEIDHAVFDLFEVPEPERRAVLALLAARVPRLAYRAG